ncbi:MAG: hypothetical protein O9314_04235 [Microcystis sp. LE19-4.1E]|jgi:ribose 1,5-bisphosphokinase|nr:hypothetical protein [Microcystis sp. LE19-4.1E]
MIRSGLLIAVVGPSGAGKDTILARLKSLLPPAHFVFPTRIISRPADGNESSAYLAADEFPLARGRGDFLIDWEAHGLSYAVPASVRRDLEQGLHVIVNLSRSVPQLLRLKGLPVLVVHVTARTEVLEQRLRNRGREFDSDQQSRLMRGEALDREVEADIRIENNGSIDSAVSALMEALMPLAGRERRSA